MCHVGIDKGKIELIEDKIIEIKIKRADIVKKNLFGNMTRLNTI
jgi:hypothetical protein